MEKNLSKYNLGGRPVAFKKSIDMAKKIAAYFDEQERVVLFHTKDGVPVHGQGSLNIQSMCAYLGITTQTLNDYAKRTEFEPIISQAKQICEAYLVDKCCISRDHKADFVLKNNYKNSWTESAEAETPQKVLVEFVGAEKSKDENDNVRNKDSDCREVQTSIADQKKD